MFEEYPLSPADSIFNADFELYRAIRALFDVVRITNLVRCLQRGENEPEKKYFQPLQKKSSTFPGSWMVSGHCGMILGQGGVVWVTLSGQEDSGDLFESRAAIRETPGVEHRLPGQIVGKWFWERNFLKSEIYTSRVSD